jgi:hypothetical protein
MVVTNIQKGEIKNMIKYRDIDYLKNKISQMDEYDSKKLAIIENKITTLSNETNRLVGKNEQLINIIEALINVEFTSNKEFEAVMIKPYRGKPILIKDGNRIDNESMTGFDIDWSQDRYIEINVRNE